MKKRAFTLVEIMVVLAVLMILVLLVVPYVWRVRVNSNESVAASGLRSLGSALNMYYINEGEFPTQMDQLLSDQSRIGYLDEPELVKEGSYSGYIFTYESEGEDEFAITAVPRSFGRTGNRCFYIDESNEVRYEERENCPAGASSTFLR